jgi:hypothetical protein
MCAHLPHDGMCWQCWGRNSPIAATHPPQGTPMSLPTQIYRRVPQPFILCRAPCQTHVFCFCCTWRTLRSTLLLLLVLLMLMLSCQ